LQRTRHNSLSPYSASSTHADLLCDLSVVHAGATGDKFALPYLLACLKHGRLSSVAFDAIYAIFMWHPNPEITALMNQACSMISTKEAAVPILDRVIELEPMYYEVNLRPVLHQYSDSHGAKVTSMQRISAVTCWFVLSARPPMVVTYACNTLDAACYASYNLFSVV